MIVNLLVANEGFTHQNWFYKDLYLNYSMVYYVVSGTAFYQDKHGTIKLKPGHLYITPTKQTFTLYDDPNNQLYHTFLHAVTLPVITKLHEVNVEESDILSDAIKLLRKYIVTHDVPVIVSILELIISNVLDKNVDTAPIALKTKQYIDEHIYEKITLDTLSDNLAYSKGHLNRVFQSEYNMSPITYYNDQRLEQSIKHLLEKKSSNDISILFNYASPAAYCKAFKGKYGLPPQKYIETILKISSAKPKS